MTGHRPVRDWWSANPMTYAVTHGRRDLPSLMAVLDHLDRATLERQRPATLPLLKEALQLQLVPDDDESGSV